MIVDEYVAWVVVGYVRVRGEVLVVWAGALELGASEVGFDVKVDVWGRF